MVGVSLHRGERPVDRRSQPSAAVGAIVVARSPDFDRRHHPTLDVERIDFDACSLRWPHTGVHGSEQRLVVGCAEAPPIAELVLPNTSTDAVDKYIGARPRDQGPSAVRGLLKDRPHLALRSCHSSGITMEGRLYDDVVGSMRLNHELSAVGSRAETAGRERQQSERFLGSTHTVKRKLLIEVHEHHRACVFHAMQEGLSPDEQTVTGEMLLGSLRRDFGYFSPGEDRKIFRHPSDAKPKLLQVGTSTLRTHERSNGSIAWADQPLVIIFSYRRSAFAARRQRRTGRARQHPGTPLAIEDARNGTLSTDDRDERVREQPRAFLVTKVHDVDEGPGVALGGTFRDQLPVRDYQRLEGRSG